MTDEELDEIIEAALARVDPERARMNRSKAGAIEQMSEMTALQIFDLGWKATTKVRFGGERAIYTLSAQEMVAMACVLDWFIGDDHPHLRAPQGADEAPPPAAQLP